MGFDQAKLDLWRATYKPSEPSAGAVERIFAEGWFLPTLEKISSRHFPGKERCVVYIKWSKFIPTTSKDSQRKIDVMEYLSFLSDWYWENGIRDILFIYDYVDWKAAQNDPVLLRDTIKIITRYDFSMKQAIVDPPWYFKPMWTVMKRTVLPKSMLADTLFVKEIGFDYACARASSAEWFARATPMLKPAGFTSALRSLFAGAAGGENECFLVFKAGSGGHSFSDLSYKKRYFWTFGGGIFAYSEGKARSYRRVYSSAGATWGEGEPPVGKGAAKYAFTITLSDGQTLALSMASRNAALRFMRAAGLDVPSPGDAENEGDDVDGLANEVDDVGVEDAADQEAAEEAKEEGWWQEGASGEKDRDRAVSSHEVGDLVGAA
ncbi:hypothetical protein AB1Y20_023587 [Prymnesium parvum]|uniref:TLDc domain-containing protein n=1 Tax=Prymnesium parvum TaxID=97485 RepID=A0AB34JEP7_PRYPA